MRPLLFAGIILSVMTIPPSSASAAPTGNAPPSDRIPADSLDVLDIEQRRIVTSERLPSDASETCDVLIVGGGLGGVAAAEAAVRRGVSVILIEPTRMLGGQLTNQLVCVPDENRFIEQINGPSTSSYRALREQVRRFYASLPGIIPGREKNIGSCWVSRVSGLPGIWEQAMEERLLPYSGPGGTLRRVYRRHQLRSVGLLANGRVNYADFVDLDSGKVRRIGARFLLDATEDGRLLEVAGLPTVAGQEAKSEFNEPHAPEIARPDWVQSFTYCFLLRWQSGGTQAPVAPPAEYEYFKSLGEYTLDYVYSDARGVVPYKVFTRADKAGGPFWTYRRLVASSNFTGRPASPEGDIALINWRGNDFHEESYLNKPLEEQVRILERGKAFSQGFLYWLQKECPRDDGSGVGYPEMQLISGEEIAGINADGFALHPYIRESRRLKARFTLNENHLIADPSRPGAQWGTAFPDSVGCALYAVDIHPSQGEPPLLFPALPYHIPLGSFLTRSGPVNVLPAAKNFGATRLALASARMHPTEWLVGEVAGALAAFCIHRDISDPAQVHNEAPLLQGFQTNLKGAGIPLYWQDILPSP